jgi:hypothetical protein
LDADEGSVGDFSIPCESRLDCIPNGWCLDGVCELFSSFPPCVDAEADCAAGESCIDDHCVPLGGADVTCEEDVDCGLIGVGCVEGICTHIDCVTSADCPEGAVCSEESCEAACVVHEDCSGTGSVWVAFVSLGGQRNARTTLIVPVN